MRNNKHAGLYQVLVKRETQEFNYVRLQPRSVFAVLWLTKISSTDVHVLKTLKRITIHFKQLGSGVTFRFLVDLISMV
jgi:hypothetical protein